MTFEERQVMVTPMNFIRCVAILCLGGEKEQAANIRIINTVYVSPVGPFILMLFGGLSILEFFPSLEGIIQDII